MKKTILAALVISTMLMGSTAVYAAPDNIPAETPSNGKVMAISCVAAKSFPSELTGIVEEISLKQMTVKAKDGEVFTVPLQQFTKQEAFKGLGIVAGTEVQLKSIMPQAVTITKDMTGVTITELDSTDLIGNITGSIKATPCTAAIAFTEAGVLANDVSLSDTAATITVMAGTTGINEGQAVLGEKLMTISEPVTFTVDHMEKVFFAEEITANGKTIKVQN